MPITIINDPNRTIASQWANATSQGLERGMQGFEDNMQQVMRFKMQQKMLKQQQKNATEIQAKAAEYQQKQVAAIQANEATYQQKLLVLAHQQKLQAMAFQQQLQETTQKHVVEQQRTQLIYSTVAGAFFLAILVAVIITRFKKMKIGADRIRSIHTHEVRED